MARSNGKGDPQIAAICAIHAASNGPLLPILHDVQGHFGYVSDEAIQQIADELNLSRADVFGVVTFYHDFHRKAQASHTLKVCRAEACQAVGGREVWSAATTASQRSEDVDLEAVYCLGNCACAPSVQLDGRTIGRMSPERVAGLFSAGGHSGAPS
ncbi:NAD(P)H-dependent oxidoreductase subunit E [Salinisphaera aquimarina]|uniref:NADH-quinone oxidoreductase subunit E n=1 Tax=Salinisphaera aquimarina TaxID=2094031 RepID=A0ABV7ES18_9GAMM